MKYYSFDIQLFAYSIVVKYAYSEIVVFYSDNYIVVFLAMVSNYTCTVIQK